jgi:hypothetical protein
LQKPTPRRSLTRILFIGPDHNIRFTATISVLCFLLCSFLGVTVHAATYTGTFTFYQTTTLDAVQLPELGLSSSGTANSEGIYTTDATWDGNATAQIMSIDKVYTSSVLQRNDVPIWYYIYKNSEQRPNFTVSYRIFSTSGIENKLSLYNDSSSTINVTITAQPVGSSSNSGKSNKICYGYANLTFDIANAKKSGSYQGRIQASITYI